MSELVRRDREKVWHPFSQHATAGDPLPIIKAKDARLFDDEGRSYIDANSSWWVNIHGHGNSYLQAAISKQFEELDHVIFANVTHPKAVELSERITAKLPSELNKVFFSDNGSTAVEVALKMCFQYWHNRNEAKSLVMAIEGAYHGDTFGAMSVGERDLFNKPFEPFFFDTTYLKFPETNSEGDILNEAESHFASGNYASLIVEPLIQGASGMRMYSVDFLDALVALARKYDVIVIFDEVMTGFGRTGKFFALDHCSSIPDIVALSKGLTAGVLPMGLTVTTTHIFEAFLSESTAKGFLHGHSYTGNPLACAVACASLDLFENEDTWNRILAISEWNLEFSHELSKWKICHNVRTMGTILAFDVQSTDRVGYFSGIRDKAYRFFLEHGILLRPLGNTIFINPPYCLTKKEYIELRDAIISFLLSLQE